MLLVFFGLLFVPTFRISTAERNIQENRVLAPYQPLWQNGKLNYNFNLDFENWFNDRFFGRTFILNSYYKLMSWLAPLAGNDKVLVGKDGWLFYKNDDGLNNFANKRKLSDLALKNGLNYLKWVDEWCKQNGKEFYYIVVPDKSKIYNEYYRLVKKMHPDSYSIGRQFVDFIRKNSDVKVLYLYDTLKQNKDKGLLYFKQDSHWNHLGAYYGYKDLMNLMGLPAKSYTFTKNNHSGDLARMLYFSVDEDKELYDFVDFDYQKFCNKNIKLNEVKCIHPQGAKRLFLLRDSYGESLMPYLIDTFSEITAFVNAQHGFTIKDFDFIKNNADVVIFINVERVIPLIITPLYVKG